MKHIKKFNELAKFKKPFPKVAKKKLDYEDMINYLEKKYDFNSRGFSGIPSKVDVDNHFNNWCDEHKLGKKDSKGKDRWSSKEFYKMYNEAEDGEKTKPPYMDFWHYIADVNEVQNGSFIIIPKDADTSEEDRISPEKMIQNYKTMMEMYPKNKEIQKNCEILIAREEEEIKNPKEDPWKNWKQEITDLIYKEFGEYDKNGDGIEVWVEW